MTMAENQDITHMHHALRLAARGLGRVAPNPAVGCVIVSRENIIVGRGWTARGGRPHAETIALAQAGSAGRGSTAYVSLEPCAHHGKTPPCADALIAARIARVVGAVRDPDPRTSGKGFEKLKAAGIEVVEGVLADEAKTLNEGFFKRIELGRPLIALKTAQSVDAKVTNGPGKDRWITSERARRHGQLLRAQHDAIMVGIGTVLADNPNLTCRIPGLEDRLPIRIVLDSKLRLPVKSKLAQTACEVPVIVFTAKKNGDDELEKLDVEVVRVKVGDTGKSDLGEVMRALASRGLTRVLVEGGPTLQAALIARHLADRLYLYQAPVVVGASGLDSPDLRGVARECVERAVFPPDVLESFVITG
jgi:diaminohydroxyphosphoribosylaminopyrimidine deaminase / 5-amino-6-(5-phosphoribosylamino)uracil reductase